MSETNRLFWQPIETAPRDGTVIILRKGDRVTSGAWFDWTDTCPEFHSTTGVYLGESDQGGGAEWSTWDDSFCKDDEPTHWTPLPAPSDDPCQPDFDAALREARQQGFKEMFDLLAEREPEYAREIVSDYGLPIPEFTATHGEAPDEAEPDCPHTMKATQNGVTVCCDCGEAPAPEGEGGDV